MSEKKKRYVLSRRRRERLAVVAGAKDESVADLVERQRKKAAQGG